ncbi:alpha-2A adrenergic receptor [Nematostella vectensis]|uniref:alpha-2A adrenergic receptor n=1 Tax=Nematostella vectensis TaxID=45351 RepID=UPI00207793F6|nr:alpha-2A adrenergic receptor [Nematostella vectensis]
MECANCSFNSSTKIPLTFAEVIGKPQVALMFVFLTFLMLWILVGNFLVVWTVYVTRRMHFAAFYFVASLSVADFLVGLLVLPISIAYHLIYEMKGQWTFGLHTCNFWLFANFWFCSASVFNLCLVSWDRYVAVTSPLHYQTRMCEERVVKLIAGNWAWSLVLAGCLIIGFHFSQQRVICSVKGIDPEILLVAVITMFILPCIFLVFVNLKVWFITRRHHHQIGISKTLELSCTTRYPESIPQENPRKWSIPRDTCELGRLSKRSLRGRAYPRRKTSVIVMIPRDVSLSILQEVPNESSITWVTKNYSIPRETRKNSSILRETRNDSSIPRETRNDSSTPRETRNDSSITRETPNNALITRDTPNDSSISRETPNDSSITRGTPNDFTITRETPNDSSIPHKILHDTWIPREITHDSSIPRETPDDSSIPCETSNDTSIPREVMNDTWISHEIPNDSDSSNPNNSSIPWKITNDSSIRRKTPSVSSFPRDEVEQVKESKYVRGLFDRGRRRTIKQEIKTFRIFLVVIGVFVACWTPFFVVMLMGIFSPVSGFVLYITIVLTYCNSALNSLIYGVLSRNCRRAMRSSISLKRWKSM